MLKKDSKGRYKPTFGEVYIRNISPADLQLICGQMDEFNERTATQAILTGIRNRVQLKKELAVAYTTNQKLENQVEELQHRLEKIKDHYRNIQDYTDALQKERQLLDKEIALSKR